MSSSIFFFSEDIEYSLPNESIITNWLQNVVTQEGYDIDHINYIFCSDSYLHSINLEHLNHDTYTDIITFDLSDAEKSLCSDIFISVDRVKENALVNNQSFIDELHRVLVHGILHLMSYNDKTKEQKDNMRKKEDACLSLRKF